MRPNGRIADGIRRWPDKNEIFIATQRLIMKVFRNTLSSFFAPMAVLLAALPIQGVPLESDAAVLVVSAFMVVKLVVQHFRLEPGRALFAGTGMAGKFRVHATLVYSVLGLCTLQLYLLASR